MTKAVRLDEEAEEEIAHAIERYELEREGLGTEFWDELRAAIRTLEAPGPECGPVVGARESWGFVASCSTAFRTRSCSSNATRSCV